MAVIDGSGMFYIDREGRTGSALGLVMFNLDDLSAEEKREYEELAGDIKAIRQWAISHSHKLDGLSGFRYITTPSMKRTLEGPLASSADKYLHGGE